MLPTIITDEVVQAQRIDVAAVEEFVRDANVVIAHNLLSTGSSPSASGRYSRRSTGRARWQKSTCANTHFARANLGYLLNSCGLFHDAHRAVDNCRAVLEILSITLPETSTTALAFLLARARGPTFRIWVENSPFDLKHILKSRGYHGSDGSPRSWYTDVAPDEHSAELKFLQSEIYQREMNPDALNDGIGAVFRAHLMQIGGGRVA